MVELWLLIWSNLQNNIWIIAYNTCNGVLRYSGQTKFPLWKPLIPVIVQLHTCIISAHFHSYLFKYLFLNVRL